MVVKYLHVVGGECYYITECLSAINLIVKHCLIQCAYICMYVCCSSCLGNAISFNVTSRQSGMHVWHMGTCIALSALVSITVSLACMWLYADVSALKLTLLRNEIRKSTKKGLFILYVASLVCHCLKHQL